LVIYIPPQIAQYYDIVAKQHPMWGQVYLGALIVGGVLMLGSAVWLLTILLRRTRRKRQRREQQRKSLSQLSATEKQKELGENLAAVDSLRDDAAIAAEMREELEQLKQRIDHKRDQQRLEIVAFGAISSGKSALLNMLAGRDVFRIDVRGGTTIQRNEVPWPGADQVILVDTPGLGEIEGTERVHMATEAAKDADVVLMVVDGPLRDFEFELVSCLGKMEKRVLLCLNKADWYDEIQQRRLSEQLAAQLQGIVTPQDIVSVAAQPVKRRRVHVRPDGTEDEEQVTVPADISSLADRMLQVVRRDGRDLLLANLLLQSRGLVEEARERVQEALDKRAWGIVDKYMWGAGGAAALSPLPLLDLAAGGAISVKMVVDLARVYRQDIDMDAAVRILGQLGKNLVSILGVNLATPAVVAAIASLLKTVPGAGTIAGGMLQGIVQALVTRWIGAVFIAYFRSEMRGDEKGLAMLAREQWNRVTSISELHKLVQAARTRLLTNTTADSEDDA